ncbi:MAG: rhodanese-like domain-containing protein [Dysgonomonas sp.]
MKKQLFILSVLLSFFSLQSCSGQSSGSSSATLKEIASHDSTLIVDVRTVDEFNSGHLENSVNIPLDAIADSVSSLRKYKDVIVVCRSGHRSSKAKDILEQKGFTNVYNGGGWTNLRDIIKKE